MREVSNTPEVIVTNMKRRFSGVTASINTLLPEQSKTIHIGFLGTNIPGALLAEKQNPNQFTRLTLWQAITLSSTRLKDGRKRIWHVRRDPEMMLSIFLRDILRLPILIVFTSAAKRRHSWFPRWLISRMDAVIATSKEASAFIPNTTAIIPHGVSLHIFHPPTDKLNAWSQTGLPGKYGIGTFGRVRPEKGTGLFVDALIELLPKYPDFTGVIVGLCQKEDLSFKKSLVDKIQAANLEGRIIFVGEVPMDQMPFWYQSVLIAVACPTYEGFGLTLLEAMACGCAVVATDTGEFRAMVTEGKTGTIIPTDSIFSLISALNNYMKNPIQAAITANNARISLLSKFSSAAEAKAIANVYFPT